MANKATSNRTQRMGEGWIEVFSPPEENLVEKVRRDPRERGGKREEKLKKGSPTAGADGRLTRLILYLSKLASFTLDSNEANISLIYEMMD